MEFNYQSRSRPRRDRNGEALLLSRLAETEALLLEERASKQALLDELSRTRLAALEQATTQAAAELAHQDYADGSSDGQDLDNRCRRSAEQGSFSAEVESRGGVGSASSAERRAAGQGGRPVEDERPAWKNVLYERQPYADNFVPDSFLEKLVTNSYVREPHLRLYVINTFAVTQQVSAVTLFLVVFMHMQDGLVSVGTMVVVDLLLLFGGYAMVFLVSPKRNASAAAPGSLARSPGGSHSQGGGPYGGRIGSNNSFEDGGKASGAGAVVGLAGGEDLEGLSLSAVSSTLASFFLFLAILRIMAPVLRTLTVSYSDDTIYALAVTLSFLHLAFHDYSYANTASGLFQGTLSLNAAIFAAVLLASRLESNEKVFGLVLFALELFAFFPLARREVKKHSLLLHASVTSAMVLPTGLLLFLRHPTLFTAYVATVILVTVACPLWLLRVQQYKLRIEGPWDIAHVEAHP
eukprot:jgi/Undpi1/2236/HiC_scaffold_12.g05622.m1